MGVEETLQSYNKTLVGSSENVIARAGHECKNIPEIILHLPQCKISMVCVQQLSNSYVKLSCQEPGLRSTTLRLNSIWQSYVCMLEYAVKRLISTKDVDAVLVCTFYY